MDDNKFTNYAPLNQLYNVGIKADISSADYGDSMNYSNIGYSFNFSIFQI